METLAQSEITKRKKNCATIKNKKIRREKNKEKKKQMRNYKKKKVIVHSIREK